jgi:hypothetical protein
MMQPLPHRIGIVKFLSLALCALFLARPQGAPETRPDALERVAVVGASLSDGFGLDHDLAEVLDAMILLEHDPITQSTTMYFFVDPLRTGPEELEAAALEDPTALVAVDFLFWFGYGTLNAEGKPLASEDERLALLDHGLELLEDFDCPIVVGDFPDMSDSIGLMLLESQVPDEPTLERLNSRLRAWSAERKNVSVLPLSRIVTTLRSGDAFTLGGLSYPEKSSERLLQSDRLHPTLEGLVVIAHLVSQALAELGAARAQDFRSEVQDVLERLGG